MEPIYTQNFEITDNMVDCYGRLRPSNILYFAQEMGGRHCTQLSLDYETLQKKRLFWAVSRHGVQITRLPMSGETIRVETWPMPSRSSFPRSVIAYDEKGEECFRSVTIWVLMNVDTRHMILPAKSGITVAGHLRGDELALPGNLVPRDMTNRAARRVAFSDLDRNGHMNNTRCMDWLADLFPSDFHEAHPLREFTVCYHSEALEGQELELMYGNLDETTVQLDAKTPEGHIAFSVRTYF